MNTPYQPISCALHSEYELAIMHKNNLELIYIDKNQKQQTIKVFPVDIQTSQGAEYLIARSEHNENHRIRLDQILEMRILDNN